MSHDTGTRTWADHDEFALGTLAYLSRIDDCAGFGEVLVMIGVMIAGRAQIVDLRAGALASPTLTSRHRASLRSPDQAGRPLPVRALGPRSLHPASAQAVVPEHDGGSPSARLASSSSVAAGARRAALVAPRRPWEDDVAVRCQSR